MSTHKFSRRTFLRGVGVTMALPWMESLTVWGDTPPVGVKPASEAPVRLAVLFSGNGFHSREWWAKGEGAQMELGKVLSPLNDFRQRMLFIRGLYNEEALKGNIHSSQTGNLLSGAPLASGGEIRSGTSVDQLLAQTYGRATKVPSLVLGCEPANPSVHKNYSMLYSSHISWSSPTTPTPLELYPALAFDRLFKDAATPGEEHPALRKLYTSIPATNFSDEVLAARPSALAVLRADSLGWSDLGEPQRVFSVAGSCRDAPLPARRCGG